MNLETLSDLAWVDRWSLRLGAALLLTAFALKMLHNLCNC